MAKKSKTVTKRKSPVTTAERARRDERARLARELRQEKEISRLAKQLPKAVRRREEDLGELIEVLEAFGYRVGRAAAPGTQS